MSGVLKLLKIFPFRAKIMKFTRNIFFAHRIPMDPGPSRGLAGTSYGCLIEDWLIIFQTSSEYYSRHENNNKIQTIIFPIIEAQF